MWKKVIDNEAQNQSPGSESVHLNNVAEPILAIDEEEEESGSREEQMKGDHQVENPEEPGLPMSLGEDSNPPEDLEEGDSQ